MKQRVFLSSFSNLFRKTGQAAKHTATQSTWRVTAEIGKQATNLIYPPVCLGCQQAVAAPHGLCAHCWASMPFISRPYCERLGTPFSVDIGGMLISPEAMAHPPSFARARSAVLYEGGARELIHAFKFSDRLDLAPLISKLMLQAGQELIAETDVLVPIPLHWTRLWQRRYNQAAVLANHLGTLMDKPVAPLALKRIRRTKAQFGLTRQERMNNLQGAFQVPEAQEIHIAERRVLLIDDIRTTSATLNAAATMLRRAGAREINVLTFAAVVPSGILAL